MSFILDALKKAEADRDPEARASLALIEHDRRRNRTLAYGIVVALIANAAVLLWLFFPASEPEPAAPVEAPVAPARAAPEPEPEPEPEPGTIDTASPPVSGPVPQTTIPVPDLSATPVALNSLSGEQRRRFPALEFSTHIYAEDSTLRAVVVNGVRLEEGDRLGNLQLEEITEDGAVFAFENRLVSVSVLDGWN